MPGYRHEINQNRRIKKLEKNVKRMKYEEETKYVSFFHSLSANNAGNIALLNGLIEGTSTGGQRIGDQVKFTSVHFRLLLTNTATSTSDRFIRFIVFWDTQPNGVIATIAGNPANVGELALLDNGNPGTTNPILFPRQQQTLERFKVLYDKVHVVRNGEISAVGPPITFTSTQNFYNFRLKLGRITQYSADNATISSISKNALYAVVLCDENDTASFTYLARIFYKDT